MAGRSNRAKTHEQFLKDLFERNKHYREGKFKVLGTYKRDNCKILLENTFGKCMTLPMNLLKGCNITMHSAIDKSEYFRNKCIERFGTEGNDDLSEVIYVNSSIKIKVIDKDFGPYWIRPYSYFNGNRNPQRGRMNQKDHNLLDKDFCFGRIKENFPQLEILPGQDYTGVHSRILVRDKYGICKVRPSNLYMGKTPTIQSAVDKNAYFTAKAKEVHGDKYDYSLVDYKNNNTKVKIKSEHGVFEQSPAAHLKGQGCPVIKQETIGWTYLKWKEAAQKSKNFDSFKVYMIECWDEYTGERFYKIGRTFLRVFGTNQRFPKKQTKGFPYKAKLIKIIEGEDAREICELEYNLKKQNKGYQYIPQKKFGGRYECFSEIKEIS